MVKHTGWLLNRYQPHAADGITSHERLLGKPYVGDTLVIGEIAMFKLQGKTLDKLVLSIAPRPLPPHLDLKGLYVMVSRVRARCGLRLLHRPPRRTGGLQYLLKLHHAPALAAWNSHYDAAGDWDPHRDPEPYVSAAAPKRRRKRPRAANSTDAE